MEKSHYSARKDQWVMMAYVAGSWHDLNLVCPLVVYLFIVVSKLNEHV